MFNESDASLKIKSKKYNETTDSSTNSITLFTDDFVLLGIINNTDKHFGYSAYHTTDSSKIRYVAIYVYAIGGISYLGECDFTAYYI